MLVVRVELHSAITGQVTEIARAHICNASGGGPIRSYGVRTLRGRSKSQLDKHVVQRTGVVKNYRATALHVWNLVADALKVLQYGSNAPQHSPIVQQPNHPPDYTGAPTDTLKAIEKAAQHLLPKET